MIFYFSATGNSLWVAKQLEEKLNERLVSINQALQSEIPVFEYALSPNERVGFVFPIHSWGPPTLLLEFIKRLKLLNYVDQQVFAVCTCGDDAGCTRELLCKHLKEKGLQLTSCHTVQMPNTYILLPFFDVDSAEVEKEKLSNANNDIDKISKAIVEISENKLLYIKGFASKIKSYLIHPLFAKHTYGSSKFHATESCIHCGSCAKSCPNRNIVMKERNPAWLQQCVQCLACIHRCPARAIEYGKITRKKGRYRHPDLF
jgi:NAD-dependent dihydropyrimidine dehydrogenase PreA subunit/flavodoxin